VTVNDPEALRVLSLPRSKPVDGAQIEALSRYCRRPGSSAMLRPQQVQMLRDLWELPGVFADMPVGAGKTLPLMLAPYLLRAERPMMLLPADLFRTSDKTDRDFARYREDWHVLLPELRSYEELARKDRAHTIMHAAPDLLLADEADPLRNPKNAVTRRVRRYRQANPRAKFCFASGTLITDNLEDYAHLSAWTLAQYSPAPLSPSVAFAWSEALKGLGDPPVPNYQGWFRGSAGVVCGAGVQCPQPIRVRCWDPGLPDHLVDLIRETEASGMRPDGELLEEMQVPTVLCSLACGLFHVWDPAPPEWWSTPRRAYLAWVREILDLELPGYDTQAQIEDVLDGRVVTDAWGQPLPLPPRVDQGRERRRRWLEVRDDFEPNSVPVWVDKSVVPPMIERTQPRGWLIWTPWPALGEELHRLGVPYYGGGSNPESADGRTIAVAVKAHYRGKNMQRYHSNLVVWPSPSARVHEQMIGRTHRAGQTRPVDVVYRTALPYHGQVLGRAYQQALKVSEARNSPQKIVLAQWS